ncbi:MAG TPA: VOC family protein [Ramlibacter sp.]|uniref:VOC family protein n=1 Tax=Ramlibacter sp. TaxID=1917967 RepID=UPI002BA51488|nr:VOC family protein [Ramlibacter sp.]HVZ42455.1 VOC family protein [Ramlibacter sp.]
MTTQLASGKSTIIPAMRYRDAHAAIEWLCRCVGFERHLVVPGPDNTVAHAQLVLGNGMVMLGSASADTEFGQRIRQPDEIGGFETQCPYVVVRDADVVFRNVKAGGATIVREIRDEEYGGRGFGFMDPQGRCWFVGTYDPWVTEPGTP